MGAWHLQETDKIILWVIEKMLEGDAGEEENGYHNDWGVSDVKHFARPELFPHNKEPSLSISSM